MRQGRPSQCAASRLTSQVQRRLGGPKAPCPLLSINQQLAAPIHAISRPAQSSHCLPPYRSSLRIHCKPRVVYDEPPARSQRANTSDAAGTRTRAMKAKGESNIEMCCSGGGEGRAGGGNLTAKLGCRKWGGAWRRTWRQTVGVSESAGHAQCWVGGGGAASQYLG